MAYTPTVWQDGVTPVNATNLNKMETGIDVADQGVTDLDARVDVLEARPVTPPVVNGQWIKGSGGAMVWSAITIADVTSLQTALDAKVDDTEKGAISGVATLDAAQRLAQQATVGKIYSVGVAEGSIPIVRSGVTVWEPVPAGGSDLSYLGDWDSGTTYQDGDIVIYNGVSYLCVEADVTTAPDPWPGGGGATLVTALPGSPSDGDEVILTDSLTAPTYSWHLRYLAAASKWLFVGGPPLFDQVDAQGPTSPTGAYGDLATVGPTVTLPAAGLYIVAIGAEANGPGGGTLNMSFQIGGTAAVDGDSAAGEFRSAGTSAFHISRESKKSLGAVAITAKYKASAANNLFQKRYLSVTPVTLG